jgi:hypothetical protein
VGRVTAPTSVHGFVDDGPFFGHVLSDATETIPDLTWPTSVQTYAQMRRDPQLTAVLKALSLPIRRATWQVDPRGARPEATRLVADGLGLPVAGADEGPTGARVRGVRWAQHCRLALLDLVFGHLPFAERYDITDKARLVSLSERMPQTIAEIDVSADGDLTSITQIGSPTDNPPIPAQYLLWYSHEREGSAWQGTSVLRPAYAPWLLKREMLRAHAIGNRRFNHGVPSVEWTPGADPTPAQVAAAQAYASAARAGDQSGGSLPPGAHLVLTGITGSVPDTLAFIRYLDQQMSRMALAGMLDLGETPNGSRALGAEFVDLFLLTLQAHADSHAEDVTGQTAARIVAYNWGEDEPVPAVVVSDVGSKREVTVEAIQSLVTSGALEPDPALDAWIRREWRIPPRETPWVQPVQRDPAGSGSAVQASGRRRREHRAAPTEPEPDLPPGSTVDPAQLDADLAAALAALLAQWAADIVPAWRAAALEAIVVAVEAGDVAAFAGIVLDAAAATAALTLAMVELAALGVTACIAEAAAQSVTVTRSAVAVAEEWLAGLAATTAALAAQGYAAAAGREAARIWQPAAPTPAVEVAARVGEHLDGLSDAWLAEQLGGVLSTAQQTGRTAVLEAAPDAEYFASETRDRNTCKPCADIDGHKFDSLDQGLAAYPTGGYSDCLGGLRCRGIVVAVWP